MDVVFFLIPLGFIILVAAVWGFIWAVNHDQFDDLEKPAHDILFEDRLERDQVVTNHHQSKKSYDY